MKRLVKNIEKKRKKRRKQKNTHASARTWLLPMNPVEECPDPTLEYFFLWSLVELANEVSTRPDGVEAECEGGVAEVLVARAKDV